MRHLQNLHTYLGLVIYICRGSIFFQRYYVFENAMNAPDLYAPTVMQARRALNGGPLDI